MYTNNATIFVIQGGFVFFGLFFLNYKFSFEIEILQNEERHFTLKWNFRSKI